MSHSRCGRHSTGSWRRPWCSPWSSATQYKRRIDKDESADVKRFIEANTVFHVTIVVFLLFFFNWFSNLSPNNEPDGQVWTIVDTVMPIVLGVTGIRMWRSAA